MRSFAGLGVILLTVQLVLHAVATGQGAIWILDVSATSSRTVTAVVNNGRVANQKLTDGNRRSVWPTADWPYLELDPYIETTSHRNNDQPKRTLHASTLFLVFLLL